MDEQSKLDALLKLKQILAEKESPQAKLAAKLQAIGRVSDPALPGQEFDQAEAIANDETGVRNSDMNHDLYRRVLIGNKALGAEHGKRFGDTYKSVSNNSLSSASSRGFQAAEDEFKKNRDRELLELELAEMLNSRK